MISSCGFPPAALETLLVLAWADGPERAGTWQVRLRVRAGKVTIDPACVETEVPMDEWVPIGVFPATEEQGGDFCETPYPRMHRIVEEVEIER